MSFPIPFFATGRAFFIPQGNLFHPFLRAAVNGGSAIKLEIHVLKIDYGTGANQEIHSQNTVDLKAIVHSAYLDFKIGQTKIVDRYKINTSFKDNLSTPDPSDDVQFILG